VYPTAKKITPDKKEVVIIGGGPAGLTAAYELCKLGLQPIVLEKENKVGGLSRTESYKGFYFDLGGHRFFTKVKEVKKLWHEILDSDFLRCPRLSRIYYNRRFFFYPIKPLNALVGLGFWESILIVLSYIKWHFFPYKREDTFEEYVTNRFGKRLFQTFFKTYTEKVWGVPCSELKAEWAAQRIKGLSLKTTLISIFLNSKQTIKSLIEEFEYPRLGPGLMWRRLSELIERHDGSVRLGSDVVKIIQNDRRIDQVEIAHNGSYETISGNCFISSMPVTEFINKLHPEPPREVLAAAARLKYRDFLTVCLIVNKPHLFPDNWIYVHDPAVRVGRIQNFKNWSLEMVPDQKMTSLGLEYFCSEGDDLWTMSDTELIELGKREVEQIGLASCNDIEDGCVIRVPKSYPIYDADYRDSLETIRKFTDGFDNFQTVGRNGLHRYNNQDHAMLTGMLAVRNLVLGERNNLWNVNTDQEYLEEISEEAQVPTDDVGAAVEGTLAKVFLKLDRVSFGLSTGIITGMAVFLATLTLVLKDGEVVGPNLQLLSQYFPSYTVTLSGSVLGLLNGFVSGFIGGWGYAFLRNSATFLYLCAIHRRAQRYYLRRFFDYC
jgi:protoporphyrinogen oxidase